MDGTADGGVPTDKYLIGDTASEQNLMRSNEDRKENNEDLQQMYDRIVGTGPNTTELATGAITGGMGNRQNSYLLEQQN